MKICSLLAHIIALLAVDYIHAATDEERVGNGLLAKPNQFPYIVSIEHWVSRLGRNLCGGSIINEEWVMTAAHCLVDGLDRYDLYFGIINKDNPSVGIHMNSRIAIVHPDYSQGKNDIGLIKLPNKLTFSSSIQPTKLPTSQGELYNNERVVVMGWGKTGTFSQPSQELRYGTLKVIDNSECSPWDIGPGHVCTISIDQGNDCQGDSGGPLVTENNSVQIGIVSFGDPQCPSKLPNVYTRVSSYLSWIAQETGSIATTTMRPNTTTISPNTTTINPNSTTIRPNTTTISPNTTTIRPNTTTISPNTTTMRPNTTTMRPNTTTNVPTTSNTTSETTTSNISEANSTTNESTIATTTISQPVAQASTSDSMTEPNTTMNEAVTA